VNGRNLDLRCRLPSGYEVLEPAARRLVQEHCSRGNVQVSMTVDRGQVPVQLVVNRPLLDQLMRLVAELESEIETAPPRLDGLLAVRGVLETVEQPEGEEQRARRETAMVEDLGRTLESLTAMRRAEGTRLKSLVLERLDTIARLVEQAVVSAADTPDKLRARLREQVAELLQASPALDQDRLAQEAALLINKVDVREELDRLQAHVAAARELLAAGGAIGRRLDFLCQELNREANTLCSKAWDVALTRIGLDLKATIDQLREQVQNIE
ncbi:MAG TPA: YicC/YloC family endoribonuclease, partial [Kiloniellales bacterium]|nr:YicC/YloC family endoribonuclease [Kiloniellales bacterium]